MVRLKKPLAIICDVEGTTTSIRFWTEFLQPFIKENLETCLKETWFELETMDVIALLRNKTAEDILVNGDHDLPPIADENAPRKEIIESVVKNVHYQMQKRRQSNELKSIHLLVWLYGYKNELIKGHVYPDVRSGFNRWKNELSIRIFTFASGDPIIQKMLFGCTSMGNLIPFIEDYFNYETIGKKTEPESYRIISRMIKVNCQEIVFLSDNISELKASQIAGVVPILVIRSHNRELSVGQHSFKFTKSFDDLEFY